MRIVTAVCSAALVAGASAWWYVNSNKPNGSPDVKKATSQADLKLATTTPQTVLADHDIRDDEDGTTVAVAAGAGTGAGAGAGAGSVSIADDVEPVAQSVPEGAKDSFVRLHGSLKLGIRAWGEPDAPVKVLALHGWLDNAASYDLLAPLLCKGRYVVAVDFVGHGLSDHRPEGVSYSVFDYVADVYQLVQRLGWTSTKFHVMGHSLGGVVGSLFTSAFPDLVQHLVMIEHLGVSPTQAAKLPGQLARSVVAAAKPHRAPRVFETLHDAAVKQSQGVTRTPLAACQILTQRGCKAVKGGFVWRSDARLREPSRAYPTEEAAEAYCRALACPVTVVLAKNGLYAYRDADATARYKTWLSTATLHELESGGHHPHLVDPAAVAAIVNEALSSH